MNKRQYKKYQKKGGYFHWPVLKAVRKKFKINKNNLFDVISSFILEKSDGGTN